jgi:hypothetical protein
VPTPQLAIPLPDGTPTPGDCFTCLGFDSGHFVNRQPATLYVLSSYGDPIPIRLAGTSPNGGTWRGCGIWSLPNVLNNCPGTSQATRNVPVEFVLDCDGSGRYRLTVSALICPFVYDTNQGPLTQVQLGESATADCTALHTATSGKRVSQFRIPVNCLTPFRTSFGLYDPIFSSYNGITEPTWLRITDQLTDSVLRSCPGGALIANPGGPPIGGPPGPCPTPTPTPSPTPRVTPLPSVSPTPTGTPTSCVTCLGSGAPPTLYFYTNRGDVVPLARKSGTGPNGGAIYEGCGLLLVFKAKQAPGFPLEVNGNRRIPVFIRLTCAPAGLDGLSQYDVSISYVCGFGTGNTVPLARLIGNDPDISCQNLVDYVFGLTGLRCTVDQWFGGPGMLTCSSPLVLDSRSSGQFFDIDHPVFGALTSADRMPLVIREVALPVPTPTPTPVPPVPCNACLGNGAPATLYVLTPGGAIAMSRGLPGNGGGVGYSGIAMLSLDRVKTTCPDGAAIYTAQVPVAASLICSMVGGVSKYECSLWYPTCGALDSAVTNLNSRQIPISTVNQLFQTPSQGGPTYLRQVSSIFEAACSTSYEVDVPAMDLVGLFGSNLATLPIRTTPVLANPTPVPATVTSVASLPSTLKAVFREAAGTCLDFLGMAITMVRSGSDSSLYVSAPGTLLCYPQYGGLISPNLRLSINADDVSQSTLTTDGGIWFPSQSYLYQPAWGGPPRFVAEYDGVNLNKGACCLGPVNIAIATDLPNNPDGTNGTDMSRLGPIPTVRTWGGTNTATSMLSGIPASGSTPENTPPAPSQLVMTHPVHGQLIMRRGFSFLDGGIPCFRATTTMQVKGVATGNCTDPLTTITIPVSYTLIGVGVNYILRVRYPRCSAVDMSSIPTTRSDGTPITEAELEAFSPLYQSQVGYPCDFKRPIRGLRFLVSQLNLPALYPADVEYPPILINEMHRSS